MQKFSEQYGVTGSKVFTFEPSSQSSKEFCQFLDDLCEAEDVVYDCGYVEYPGSIFPTRVYTVRLKGWVEDPANSLTEAGLDELSTRLEVATGGDTTLRPYYDPDERILIAAVCGDCAPEVHKSFNHLGAHLVRFGDKVTGYLDPMEVGSGTARCAGDEPPNLPLVIIGFLPDDKQAVSGWLTTVRGTGSYRTMSDLCDKCGVRVDFNCLPHHLVSNVLHLFSSDIGIPVYVAKHPRNYMEAVRDPGKRGPVRKRLVRAIAQYHAYDDWEMNFSWYTVGGLPDHKGWKPPGPPPEKKHFSGDDAL